MLGSPIAMSEVFAKSGLDHRDLCSLVSRLVLDVMVERGYRFGAAGKPHYYTVTFRPHTAVHPIAGSASGPSFNRAICEAAIQALKQEQGNG